MKRHTTAAKNFDWSSSLLVIGLVALAWNFRHLLNANPARDAQGLAKAAEEINATAPKMLNDDLQLSGAVAGPGQRFTYVYRYPNQLAQDVEWGPFQSEIRPKIVKQACAELKAELAAGLETHFTFWSKDEVLFSRFIVKQADCDALG